MTDRLTAKKETDKKDMLNVTVAGTKKLAPELRLDRIIASLAPAGFLVRKGEVIVTSRAYWSGFSEILAAHCGNLTTTADDYFGNMLASKRHGARLAYAQLGSATTATSTTRRR